jgi:uncharacterized protein (DUF305 family)
MGSRSRQAVPTRPAVSCRVAAVLLFCAVASVPACSVSRSAPLLQPGPPGRETRAIDPRTASDLSNVGYTADDVRFMQGMIGHHAQAIEMVALLESRTERDDMKLLGRRIEASQADEMAMMRDWLAARGQAVSEAAPAGGHADHEHHGGHGALMPGMLSPAEMSALAGAHGRAFDRLFLAGMIRHHQGALTMVSQLFALPRAAQESEVFAFASDVEADQRMEIERMGALLHQLDEGDR